MLRLQSEITINEITFNAVVRVEIESTWENLTDNCIIELPNNFKREGRNITVGDEGFFKRGDAITVKLGYFPNIETVFEGYIRKIFVDNVIIIEAEDEAFKLKQNSITKSYKSVDLSTLISDVAPIEVNVVNSELGAFRITRATTAKVLEELKKTYGLVSYIKNKILRVGLAYYPDESKEITLDFENTIIENNLEFTEANELPLYIVGTTATSDPKKPLIRYAYYNDKQEIIVADTPPNIGEPEKFTIKTAIPQADLDNYITRRLEKRMSEGTRGDVVTFLQPSIEHGDTVTLISRKFPERNGSFLVKKVVKTFGLDGGRQIVTLHTQTA